MLIKQLLKVNESLEEAALKFLDGQNATTQTVAYELRCSTVLARNLLTKLEQDGKVRSWKVGKEWWWNIT